jgi:hypothetical protein
VQDGLRRAGRARGEVKQAVVGVSRGKDIARIGIDLLPRQVVAVRDDGLADRPFELRNRSRAGRVGDQEQGIDPLARPSQVVGLITPVETGQARSAPADRQRRHHVGDVVAAEPGNPRARPDPSSREVGRRLIDRAI